MKHLDLKRMSVDQLWALRKTLAFELGRKIAAEKSRLERRLRQLEPGVRAQKSTHARRPYPQVFPKYRNPEKPTETWAGRGKQPRWLTAQLQSGKKLDDFRIQTSADSNRRSR